MNNPPIQTLSPDDFPSCPCCNARPETVFTTINGVVMPKPVWVDDDGPVFAARCPNGHDDVWFQVVEHDDEEAD